MPAWRSTRRRRHARRALRHAPPPFLEHFARVAEGVLLEQMIEALAARLQTPADAAFELPSALVDAATDGGAIADRDLGGVRRRRRAHVGDEIGERRVHLVADAGDDRNAASGDRPDHRLLV